MIHTKNHFLKKTLALLVSVLVCSSSIASSTGAKRGMRILPDTVKNFELPNFNDTTGVKEWEVFGKKALYVSDEQLDIDDLKLDIFEGKQTAAIKVSITSPNANVNPQTKFAKSLATLLAKGEDFQLKGKKWSWNGDKKFVEIFSEVEIDINSISNISIEETAKKDEDKKSPTKIFGDYASLSHGGKENYFTVKKNVKVKNAQLDMTCGEIDLETSKSTSGKIGKIDAKEKVNMLYGQYRATAELVEMIPDKETAVLSINPQIEDIQSGAKIEGDKIDLDKNKKTLFVKSATKQRAKAIISHGYKEAKKPITVYADSILLAEQKNNSKMDFVGNVEIISEDFSARCDKMDAIIADKSQKDVSRISIINGYGNVRVINSNGTATAKKFEAVPSGSELWLYEDVKLRDPKRGFNLDADTMVFMKEQNSGMALTDKSKKNSFVKVEMAQTPKIEGVPTKKNEKTVIKSRILNFSRSQNDAVYLRFSKDVSIKSDATDAVCQILEVWSDSKNGANNISKIVARDSVVVKQKEYTANTELAHIYPNKEQTDDKEKSHKFVELMTPENAPDKRPYIILPPIGNLGLKDDEVSGKSKSAPTVITSDKQWLSAKADSDEYFFQGNVKISGTDMNGDSQSVKVIMLPNKKTGRREIAQVIMSGDVKLSQGLKDVTCGRADYYANEEMIVLSRDPVVRNREDNTRATGYRIVYNRGKQTISVEGEDKTQDSDASYQGEPTPPARPTITLPPVGNLR